MIQGVSEPSQTQCLKKRKEEKYWIKEWLICITKIMVNLTICPCLKAFSSSTCGNINCHYHNLQDEEHDELKQSTTTTQGDNVIHPQYKGFNHNLEPHTKKTNSILNQILKKQIHYYLKIVNICYLLILKCMAENLTNQGKGKKGDMEIANRVNRYRGSCCLLQ